MGSPELEKQLEELQRKLSLLFDSSLAGIVAGDISGRMFQCNDAFLRIVGYSREEFNDSFSSWLAVTPPEFQAISKHVVGEVLRTGLPRVYEKEYLTKGGGRVPVLVGLTLSNREKGEFIVFILDMTAQKEAEKRRLALMKAEEAIRGRDDFSAIASHELNTPITTLILQIGALRKLLESRKEGVEEPVEKMLAGCERTVSKIAGLTNELFDVTKIKKGGLSLNLQPVEFCSFLEKTIQTFRLGTYADPALLELKCGDRIQGFWDPMRLAQVVENLLTNAVKYGGGKRIEVQAYLEGETAVLVVRDNGKGIPPERQARIFDLYFQVREVGTSTGGLGIGLFISKQIVEAHGGRIEVESTPPDGCRFTVRLPLKV